MMTLFIDIHREELGIEPICRLVVQSHAARLADPSRRPVRARRNDEMKAASSRVHDASFGVCGTREVWHQLLQEDVVVAKCTIAR